MNQNDPGWNQNTPYGGGYPGNGYPYSGGYQTQNSGEYQPQMTAGGQASAGQYQSNPYQTNGYQANAYQTNPAAYGSQGYYAQNPYSAPAHQATQNGRQAYFQSNQQPYTGSQAAQPGMQGGGYAQQPTGYTQAAGYPGYQQGGGFTQGVYPQSTGTNAPYIQQPQQSGSYIPQTPYQQGYPAGGGYQAPGGYAQPYTGYTQMGQAPQMPTGPQNTGGHMPLNGGGYVPQPVHVRRRPFEISNMMLLIMGGVLLLLFLLCLFFPKMLILKVLFLVPAIGSIILLWVKPMTANNKRMTYTIIFSVLSAMLLIISVLNGMQGGNGAVSNPGSGSDAVTTAEKPSNPTQEDPDFSGMAVSDTETPTGTPEPQEDTSALERLQSFFTYWATNRQDDMLTLCAPSWVSSVENPKMELFGLLANRTPKDYTFENISGTSYDTSRTVTLTSLMDKNNGKKPVKYRLNVIVVKESDQWYVDPKSLLTYDIDETPDPSITPTPGPTETPYTDANTPLYYNPNGGEYYHRDQNCKKINAKFLPLKGHFKFSEINDEKYKNLKPCSVCGAPLREQ